MRPVRYGLLRVLRHQTPRQPPSRFVGNAASCPHRSPALDHGTSLIKAIDLSPNVGHEAPTETMANGCLKDEESWRSGAGPATCLPDHGMPQFTTRTRSKNPLSHTVKHEKAQRLRTFLRRKSDQQIYTATPASGLAQKPNNVGSHDINQWARTLAFKIRIDGSRGAWRMLNEVDKKGINLPTDGAEADRIWASLVQAGTHDARLLQLVFQHALNIYVRESRRWMGLYESIVGYFLNSASGKIARYWHNQLSRLGLPTERSVAHLVKIAIKSRSRLDILKTLSSSLSLYDLLIPALCEKRDFVAAAHWDQYLKARNDCPSEERFDFITISDKLDAPKESLEKYELTEDAMLPSYVKVPSHIKAVDYIERARRPRGGLTDSFVARCFATRSFSLDAIIAGLRTIGLSVLGPLGMREMAIRSSSPSDILDRIDKLQSHGVLVQDCIFTRLVHRLATDENKIMLDSMLESDLHPDAYEDNELQKRLLSFYIKSKDWQQAHRTLILLDTFFEMQSVRFWNLLLRTHFADRDWDRAEDAYETMLSRGIPITSRTIRLSFFSIEQRRYATVAERVKIENHATQLGDSRRDDLKMVTNMWLRVQRAGGYIDARSWNQLHKYYGQDSRFAELESLSIWLALNYSQDSLLTLGNRRWSRQWRLNPKVRWDQEDKETSPLSVIFSPLRQRSIVEWGFKSVALPLKTRDLGFEPRGPSAGWDRGLLLLRELQRLGVTLDRSAIQKACRHRLEILFSGESRASLRRENRMAKENNDENLLSMVKRINEIWNVWPEVVAMTEDEAHDYILGTHQRSQRNSRLDHKWSGHF